MRRRIFLNLNKALMAGSLLCFAALSSTAGAEGAESNGKLTVELPAQGRAFLTAEDLQTLLGIKSRDPSSKEAGQSQDVTVSAPSFYFSLSASEKTQVARVISKVRMDRTKLEKNLKEKSKTTKQALRNKRKSIQLSRVKTGENGHNKLGRDLFASLLAEANAEAGVEAALKNFDERHQIEIQFIIDEAGQKTIAAIKLGREIVWSDARIKNAFVAGM